MLGCVCDTRHKWNVHYLFSIHDSHFPKYFPPPIATLQFNLFKQQNCITRFIIASNINTKPQLSDKKTNKTI